ncbi:hypothetical protein GSY74_07955 [Sulfurovum sp. bin170]|uniref:hypothetical protein n=1 Tax=Sulfurovum sp. bin170 TaxID=2695268 RepID=UPI0013E022D6|nr:hypothetical protein [Sulfurovum sp. bin170]NEW61214.1 hypothetical protein [Sulfurovum sp. bin170]
MIGLKQHFVSLFIFVYLTVSYLGATHIHNDTTEHHESCSICIIVHNFYGLDEDITSIETLFYAVYETIHTSSQISISTILLKGFNAHAPPA